MQCAISLSVISPKQLPKLRAIYNAVWCILSCSLVLLTLILIWFISTSTFTVIFLLFDLLQRSNFTFCSFLSFAKNLGQKSLHVLIISCRYKFCLQVFSLWIYPITCNLFHISDIFMKSTLTCQPFEFCLNVKYDENWVYKFKVNGGPFWQDWQPHLTLGFILAQ